MILRRILLMALFTLPVWADPPMTKLRVEVRKASNDKPVERASVIVRFVEGRSAVKLGKKIMTSYQLKTNQEGVALIPPIPQGKIQVQIIAKGLQTFGQIFDIGEEEKTVEIKLNDPQAQQALMAQLGKLRGEASHATLGMVQALVTLHGTAFDEVSRDSSSRLLQALNSPHMNDSKRLQWLFLSTLNRNPTKQEEAAFSSVINEAIASATKPDANAETPPPATWQSDLLWALINSTEFAMTP